MCDADFDIRREALALELRRREVCREFSGVAGGDVSVVVYVEDILDALRAFLLSGQLWREQKHH